MNWFLCHIRFLSYWPPIVLILSFSINRVQSSVLFTFLLLPWLNMILHSFGLFSRDPRLSSSPGTPLWRCAVTGRWRRRWTSPDSWKWDTWMWPTRLTCKHSDVSHVTDRSFCMSVLLSRESFIDFLFLSEYCGALEYYDKAFDRVTTRNEKPLKSIKRIFHTVTTTDDPVIRKVLQSTLPHDHFSCHCLCLTILYMYLFCYKW